MIHYWEGKTTATQLRPGDILFVTGKLPFANSPLPFEHVALVAEIRSIRSVADLADVYVYGMPESGSRTRPGLIKAKAEHFRRQSPRWNEIGSQIALWNMAARPRVISLLQESYMMDFLSLQSSRRHNYTLEFDDEAFDKPDFQASCTGFVCSVWRRQSVHLLKKSYPRYVSPYTFGPPIRDYPSPGHLARALHLGESHQPYRPKNGTEATDYARASRTLENVSQSFLKRVIKFVRAVAGRLFDLRATS